MPTPINILKEWFSNLKKPNQEQFWAWMDSFYFKGSPIPTAGIENLDNILAKKADLVDGVVPEEQLPFSVVTSEVITLGAVSIVDDQLNLAVHSSGANKVRVKGKMITRTFPNQWNFTPIQENGIKVIRGYAVKNENDFFISEGAELPEFELPEVPEDALQLFIVTITNAGATIDTGGESGFKYKAESAWKSVLITSNTPRWIGISSDESMFEIMEQNASMPLISGIVSKAGKWIYPGKTFGILNASGRDIKIQRNDVRPPFNPLQIANYFTFPVGTDITIKPGEYFWFKIKGLELVVLKFGGSASFPVTSTDGLALISDATSPEKVKWYNGFFDKLTTTAQSVASFVTFSGNFRAKRHYYSVDETPDASPLKDWTDGVRRYFTNAAGVSKQISFGTVFIYTPTSNFTVSSIKTALEAQGMIFNDSHIIVNLGTNNYTCSIDMGASNPNTLFTIGKRGSGSINFTSVRTLNSGVESIIILSGNEGSMAKVEFGTSVDILTIINL